MFDIRSSALKISAIGLLAIGAGLICALPASAGQVVVVQLHDGRMLTGEVDQRTDDAELWLHSTEPSIVAFTAVPWSDVAGARLGNSTLTGDAFRKAAQPLKSAIPLATFRQPAAVAVRPPPVPRVQSFEMLATLANWDRDVEPDGLEVRVTPLTADGRIAAVDGMLTVRLLGRRLGSYERLESLNSFGFWTDGGSTREYRPRLNSNRYVEVGRWSERLKARDMTDLGYVLRLPFRTLQPESDLDIALDGVVDTRFSVNGQAAFVATSPIQLREFSPLREELQLNRGTRFFPDEYRSR